MKKGTALFFLHVHVMLGKISIYFFQRKHLNYEKHISVALKYGFQVL